MSGNVRLFDMGTRTCGYISLPLSLRILTLVSYDFSCRMIIRNIAEQLIEKGLASIVHHRRDDEDRSPDYDKFMAAEQA